MKGDVVSEKEDIFTIRKQQDEAMKKYSTALAPFLEKYNFYPVVFYNENNINDPTYGIRAAIPNLDDFAGVFLHQDSPDTPIEGFNGIEFRTSLTKSIAAKHKQLLWTTNDFTGMRRYPRSEYDEKPSVSFGGTTVYMSNGQVFPQQAARVMSIFALATSGLLTQINLKQQKFENNSFIEVSGTHLSEQDYNSLLQRHPYGLSVRGWGNWDLRFYEMLACGRIPVHVRTDDELLFERDIPWEEYIVIVDRLDHIKEDVEDFHSQFSDDKSLGQHQDRLVKLYHEWLSFPAFCKHFEEYYADDILRMLP